jgi:carboxyl-terminal processing protease
LPQTFAAGYDTGKPYLAPSRSMSRRNLLTLLIVSLVSLACYHRVQHHRYGNTLAFAIDLIERRALEPVPADRLFEGAMHGILSGLDDQYSGYIPPAELQRFNEEIDQEFGGVGMEVILDPQSRQIMVGSPMLGSPAQRAGIRSGDRILRINDKSTQGLSLEDAVRLMRGKLGEEVVLTIQHEGDDEPQEVTLVRATIHVDTVVGDSRNSDGSWNFFLDGHDRIGYLRITSFGKETLTELRRALQWLSEHQMRALVLDLRDDRGGLLHAAVGVCDLFIADGVIVSTRGRQRDQIRDLYKASGRGKFTDFPIAVLVNGDTASASEIVAACLQDNNRAVVVGQRTYGKGTVQEVIDLDENHGAIRLTTASYWRPSGKNIHRTRDAKPDSDWGVMPNDEYEVVVEGDELVKLHTARARRDVVKRNGSANGEPLPADRQLDRALEYLREQLKSA